MPVPEMSGRKLLVLYGSATGNAQNTAEELGRMMQRLHFSSTVLALDAVELAMLAKQPLVLIAISTAGQGDLPESSRLFWNKLLRRRLPPSLLQNVRFGLFGLGDSSYPQYNFAGLKLSRRLVQLGAREVIPRGEGDEQHPEGIDASFTSWSKRLRQQILELFPLEAGLEPISDKALLQPHWLLTEAHAGILNDIALDGQLPKSGNNIDVTLVQNDRVTSHQHWQDVRHLIFFTETSSTYAPGDILTIYPKNSMDDVDQLIELMGWQNMADQPVKLSPNRSCLSPAPLEMPEFALNGNKMTLKAILTNCLDLNAIPRCSFFSLIAHFTTDSVQKDRLQEFASPEFVEDLFDYTTRPRRSILEVLQEFSTINLPWQWATAVLPPLRGRQFSIASGGLIKTSANGGTRFDLLVAIVKYKTVIRKIRRGVCTRYLENLPLQSRIRVTLVKGGLGIKGAETQKPIVMVAPGTGVAPMRSLIWERLLWANPASDLQTNDQGRATSTHGAGQNLLFFGCRNKDADYFFSEEWSYIGNKIPLRVFAAFSRDQLQKVYVQDLIRSQGELVFRLLHDEGGILYICGSSGKMPLAVRDALVDVFQEFMHVDRCDAETYLKSMEKGSRYKQETW